MKVAEQQNDLEDTSIPRKKSCAHGEVNCENKKEEWAEYKEMQGQEMLALADTIQVLTLLSSSRRHSQVLHQKAFAES